MSARSDWLGHLPHQQLARADLLSAWDHKLSAFSRVVPRVDLTDFMHQRTDPG